MEIEQKFVGTWKFISCESQDSGGKIEYPFGSKPIGRLIYDAFGNMSVQAMAGQDLQDLQDLASKHVLLSKMIDEDIQSFIEDLNYFGTYKVDKEKGEVIHHIEGGFTTFFKQHSKKSRKIEMRKFDFKEDHLTLTAQLPSPHGGSVTIVWQRMA